MADQSDSGKAGAALDGLRQLLAEAAEAGAQRALAKLPPERRGGLVPIKQAPVAYRTILDAERAGELVVYRRGKASFVDVTELEAWIRRAPTRPARDTEPAPPPEDAVGELIALSNSRRQRRGSAA